MTQRPRVTRVDWTDDPEIGRLVGILRDYDPERIILFGSRARGEAREHSDYDLVVIKRSHRPFLDRMQEMVPYLIRFGRAAEILVYTPEEFEGLPDIGLGWILRREGVTLYERGRG